MNELEKERKLDLSEELVLELRKEYNRAKRERRFWRIFQFRKAPRKFVKNYLKYNHNTIYRVLFPIAVSRERDEYILKLAEIMNTTRKAVYTHLENHNKERA